MGKPQLGYWVSRCGKVRNFSIRYMAGCLFDDDMEISLQKVIDQKVPKYKMARVTGRVFSQTAGNPYSCGWCCALVKSMTNPEVSTCLGVLLAAACHLYEGYVRLC